MTDQEKNEMFKRNEKLIYLAINRVGLKKIENEIYDIGLIGITRGINSYDETKGYKETTYLYKCIYNELIKYVRINYKRDMFRLNMLSIDKKISEDINFGDFVPDTIDIENETIKKEEKQELYYYISKLKPEYEYIILRTFGIKYKQKSHTELEKELGISHQAISDKCRRALKELKKIMEEDMKLKESDTKLMSAMSQLKVKCKCGHSQMIPVYVDSAYCTHCGKKLQNNTKAYFKYKMRKELLK